MCCTIVVLSTWDHTRWRLVVTLGLACLVLAAYQRDYWRPFDDTAQEAVASLHAYGFAAANEAWVGPNLIAARDIDVEASQVRLNPHWPNGFFLALAAALRIFGRNEAVGRSVAIAANVAGMTLAAASLGRSGWLVHVSVPLVLLSAMGRDVVPFVFVDASLVFWVGVLLWVRRSWVFRAVLAAAIWSAHLVAPFAAVIIGLRWREKRSGREALKDAVTLAAAGGVVLLGLAAVAGAGEVRSIVEQRSAWPLPAVWTKLAQDLICSFNLEPVTTYVVAGAWVAVAAARQWRVAALLPSFLLYALLLREYVAAHVFTRLLWVFFSLVTLGGAVELALQRLSRRAAWAARILVALVLVWRLAGGVRQYGPDLRVAATRQALSRTVRKPENRATLEHCNAFRFFHWGHQWDPADRIGQFFFGPQVVERVQRGGPVRLCEVDVAAETVTVH